MQYGIVIRFSNKEKRLVIYEIMYYKNITTKGPTKT